MMLGNKYQIEYINTVVQEDIPALPASARSLIKKAIEHRLTIDPVGFGKPLRYSLKGHRRLRVSNYRVVYRIEEKTNKVIIIAIKHRKDIYEDE
jgi:mRNA interferase RelE/StbE